LRVRQNKTTTTANTSRPSRSAVDLQDTMIPAHSASQASSTTTAIFRKAILRLLRDVRIRLRAVVSVSCIACTVVVASTSFVLLLLLAAYRHGVGRPAAAAADNLFPNASARPPANGFCACSDARDWHRVKHVLSSADFVARVFMHDDDDDNNSSNNKRSGCIHHHEWATATCIGIHTLFRGSPRLALHPVLVSNAHVHACVDSLLDSSKHDEPSSNSVHDAEHTSRLAGEANVALESGQDKTVLLVAGIGEYETARAANATILVPESTCGVIWAVRWTLLAEDVRDAIASDVSSHSEGWWRYRQTWSNPLLEWWSNPADGHSVTVVAACKDRQETLRHAAESWRFVRGVSEIVLFDFGSAVALSSVISPSLLQDRRLVLASSTRQNGWILSRAYNAAIQLASSAIVLKVDCDTVLEADFLDTHVVRKGEFFAGDWRALPSRAESEQLHVNGLLLAHRGDLVSVGGYDERVTTYGWDDTDIAARLGRISTAKRFNYSKVRHLSHPSSMRVESQRQLSLLPPENPLAALVETQRNRLLLTRCGLHLWQENSYRVYWNVAARSVGSTNLSFLLFSQANNIPSGADLVSSDQVLEMSKRAIRLVLLRYGVSLLPKTLSLGFYLGLAARVGFPEKYLQVDWQLHGGCISRLLSIAASRAVSGSAEASGLLSASESDVSSLSDAAAVTPPYPHVGWRFRFLWRQPDVDCSCRFSNSFIVNDIEVVSSSQHTMNTSHIPLIPRTLNRTNETNDVRFLLQSALNKSELNASARKIFVGDLACDVVPSAASNLHRDAVRAALRSMKPTSGTHDALLLSLGRGARLVLDYEDLSANVGNEYVGVEAAKELEQAFADPAVRGMIGSWGASSSLRRRNRFQLDRRAIALCTAMMISTIPDSTGRNFAKQLEYLRRRVRDMFHGCPGTPSEYFKAYPELAVIVTALLSADVCTTSASVTRK
jgi:hypothetical protein